MSSLLFISIPDLIIIIVLIILFTYLFYLTFIKHKNEPCKGCAYAKCCKKKNEMKTKEKNEKCEILKK